VSRAQLGSLPGDLAGGGLDGRRKGSQEVVNGITATWALPQRRDEDFGIGRSWNNKSVPAIADGRYRLAGMVVMRIVCVQDGDQDPGVENGQVHSRRRSSR
jgi:hypothetical protein